MNYELQINKLPNKIPGIYMAVDYHLNTDFILNKMAKELGIIPDNGYDEHYNLREYKYHTTIIYAKFSKPLDSNNKLVQFKTKNGSSIFEKKKPKLQIPVKILGVGFFDTEDGINFHLKVSSPFLLSEFKRAIQYGLPTDFPNYNPHITIKKSVTKEFKERMLKGEYKTILQKYINATIYTNDEYIEVLDNK